MLLVYLLRPIDLTPDIHQPRYRLRVGGPLDYDSDDDPLGYMTRDYPTPYTVESSIDMQRRFFLRGRSAPHAWQRVLVRLLLVIPLAFLVGGVLWGCVNVIKELFAS